LSNPVSEGPFFLSRRYRRLQHAKRGSELCSEANSLLTFCPKIKTGVKYICLRGRSWHHRLFHINVVLDNGSLVLGIIHKAVVVHFVRRVCSCVLLDPELYYLMVLGCQDAKIQHGLCSCVINYFASLHFGLFSVPSTGMVVEQDGLIQYYLLPQPSQVDDVLQF
jgi:hypothetical protein